MPIRIAAGSGRATLELHCDADLDSAKFVSPVGIARCETGFNGGIGLGHIALPAPRFAEASRSYREVPGFAEPGSVHSHFSSKPNDPSQGLHFLHGDNPRHCTCALFDDRCDTSSGCVPAILQICSTDEVGYCLNRVQAAGVPSVSTPNLHTSDLQLSFEFARAGGFAMEFGCAGQEMDWHGCTPTASTPPNLWGNKFRM